MLQEDTVEGMFADPLYGGNRDSSAGSSSATRARSAPTPPNELQHGPQHGACRGSGDGAMHAGEPQNHVVLPISGTRRTAGS